MAPNRDDHHTQPSPLTDQAPSPEALAAPAAAKAGDDAGFAPDGAWANDGDDDGDDGDDEAAYRERARDADFLKSVDFPEYQGEVKARSPRVIGLLAWVCPGLAYGYVGEFAAAIFVNTSFVLSVTLFVMLWTRLRFFPLWPGLVLAFGWMVSMAWIWRDVRRRARELQPYVLRPVNHGVVYAAVALMTYGLPLLTAGWYASSQVWGRVWSSDEAMYPGVVAGDMLLIDRTAYRAKPPARGELVFVEAPDGEALLGRVVGIEGDRVQFENGWPLVGAKPLDHYDGGALAAVTGGDVPGLVAPWNGAQAGALLRFEVPHRMGSYDSGEPGRWYPVLTSADAERLTPGALQRTEPIEVMAGEVLLLNDNRTVAMSPGLEPSVGRRIPLDWVEGRPLYVLLSRAPDGAWRWDRVGLRLR
jgi:signal peptidase I